MTLIFSTFGYPYKYFNLNIHQKINIRQQQNALKVNWLFYMVLDRSENTLKADNRIDVTLCPYHANAWNIGKKHSKFPKENE